MNKHAPLAGARGFSQPYIPTQHLELDVTMDVALTNLFHGLRKLRHVLAETGDGDAFFIPTPDFSTTSNSARWKSGFSYGGALFWNSSRPIAFPELRPNACGVLLGKQNEPFCLPLIKERIARAQEVFKEDWDYDKSNHFIGLYERGSSWYFLLHGGTKSIRTTLGLFEGASTDPKFTVYENCQPARTPFGPLYTLYDDKALDYFSAFKLCEEQIKQQREKLAEFLFLSGACVFHETHQGLVSPTAMALGSYLLDATCPQVPLMIAPGEPLLILTRGAHTLPDHPIYSQVKGLLNSAPTETWIAPHGSGDYLADVKDFSYIEESDRRLFCFVLTDGSQVVAETPCSLREGHRSKTQAISALNKMGVEIADRLEHIVTLRS